MPVHFSRSRCRPRLCDRLITLPTHAQDTYLYSFFLSWGIEPPHQLPGWAFPCVSPRHSGFLARGCGVSYSGKKKKNSPRGFCLYLFYLHSSKEWKRLYKNLSLYLNTESRYEIQKSLNMKYLGKWQVPKHDFSLLSNTYPTSDSPLNPSFE